MVEKILSLRSVSLKHEMQHGTFMMWHAYATQETFDQDVEPHSVASADKCGTHQIRCGKSLSPEVGGQVEWQARKEMLVRLLQQKTVQEDESLLHWALCVWFVEAVTQRSYHVNVPAPGVGTDVFRFHALLQVQEQGCLHSLLLFWQKHAVGMRRQAELGHHLASACQRHSGVLELAWAMRAWVDVMRMQADQAESPCNIAPTVTVAKDRPQRRLLFALLSTQETACFGACVAAWREYVDNQRRLEFRDARLEESRRMSNLVDAACKRWQKFDNALLLCALLHHWSSIAGFSQGNKLNVVPEPSPRTALHLRNFRSSTLKRVLLSPQQTYHNIKVA